MKGMYEWTPPTDGTLRINMQHTGWKAAHTVTVEVLRRTAGGTPADLMPQVSFLTGGVLVQSYDGSYEFWPWTRIENVEFIPRRDQAA